MYISGPSGSFPFYGYVTDGVVGAYTYYNEASQEWGLVNSNATVVLKATSQNDIEIENNIHADAFKYHEPELRYVSVSGNLFQSASDIPHQINTFTNGTYVTQVTSGSLVAQVNIPDGAKISGMRVFCTDSFSGGSLITSFKVQQHGQYSRTAIVSTTTFQQASGDLELYDQPNTDTYIDYAQNHYYLEVFSDQWSGSANMRIDSVIIEYLVSEPD